MKTLFTEEDKIRIVKPRKFSMKKYEAMLLNGMSISEASIKCYGYSYHPSMVKFCKTQEEVDNFYRVKNGEKPIYKNQFKKLLQYLNIIK